MKKLVVGIVGTGTMGQGIAQLAAASGATVIAFDRAPAALNALKPSIEKNLSRRVEKGQITPDEMRSALERISTASRLDALGECALVIEAVSENLAVKKELLRELEPHLSSRTIVATNTSSLSVTAIASCSRAPERVVGLHFFNPAPILPLVEVVAAVQSSEECLRFGEETVRAWGKSPIRVQDTPAFVVNRIARPFYGEALRIVEEGIAEPSTVDWAMQHFGKFKMGPFELMDLIGLDVNYAVTESVFQAFSYDSRYRPSLIQKRMVEAGRLGRKSGRGFFSYVDSAQRPEPLMDPALGTKIFDRIFAMLVNEAYDAVFWQVASPEDIDRAMVLGVSYPQGLLAWAEESGPEKVLAQLDALHTEYAEERYRPSVLLRRMVSSGERFFKGAKKHA